jgi:hypothetical protein
MSKRIRDLKPSSTVWREWIVGKIARPFASLSGDQRFWIGFAALCILTTLLIQNPFWTSTPESAYSEGDIAREALISPADISVTDQEEHERLRAAARDAVKPIFRFESNQAEQAVRSFVSAWEKLQRHGNAEPANTKQSDADLKSESHWTGAGGSDVGKVFAARTFSRNELEAVQSALRESAAGYIYDDADRQYFQNEVQVFDRLRPNLRSTVTMPESNWTALSVAREKLKTRLNSIRSLSPKEIDAFYTAAEILVEPSISYDSVATETARSTAADNTQPRTITLKRGQKIVDTGDIITQDVGDSDLCVIVEAVQQVCGAAAFRYSTFLDRVEIYPASRAFAEACPFGRENVCPNGICRADTDGDSGGLFPAGRVYGRSKCCRSPQRSHFVGLCYSIRRGQLADDLACGPSDSALYGTSKFTHRGPARTAWTGIYDLCGDRLIGRRLWHRPLP